MRHPPKTIGRGDRLTGALPKLARVKPRTGLFAFGATAKVSRR